MTIIWERLDLLQKPSHEHRTTDGPAVIVVSGDKKIRIYADRRSDGWFTLYRRDVPNLTDEDWFACPGEGWTQRLS